MTTTTTPGPRATKAAASRDLTEENADRGGGAADEEHAEKGHNDLADIQISALVRDDANLRAAEPDLETRRHDPPARRAADKIK